MPRGGAASSRRGILLWSLLATPACGLVVGFEPRELCDDCADSSGAAGGAVATSSGGASSTGGTTAAGSSEGNAEGLGVVDTASATGGSASGGSGSDASSGGTGAEPGVGGSASGGTTTGGGASSNTNGGAGGISTAGGASSTDTGGTGGETVSSSAGGTTTDSGGMGGNGGGAGGSDGGTGSTSTGTGGSTSVGGTGSGGNGGTPSPCESEGPFNVTLTTGTHPAALMLGLNNSTRLWDFSWVENDDVYVSARSANGSVLLDPELLDGTGTHSASVIATQGQYAFVAYGELASGNARIVMSQLNPLDADTVMSDATDTLESDTAPRVVGVTHRGSSSDMLVAALDSEGAGLLALFSDGQFVTSLTVPGSFDDLTPLDLGESFAIASIEDGSLQVALVPYDLSSVELPVEVEGASPIAPALGSLSGTATDDGAALVWLEANGVHLTIVDDDGVAESSPISVAAGTNALPKLDVLGPHLFVSWIDTSSDTLYVQRVLGDLSGDAEQPFEVEAGVAEVGYGLAADPFSGTPTLALVYSTDRLRMSIITCSPE